MMIDALAIGGPASGRLFFFGRLEIPFRRRNEERFYAHMVVPVMRYDYWRLSGLPDEMSPTAQYDRVIYGLRAFKLGKEWLWFAIPENQSQEETLRIVLAGFQSYAVIQRNPQLEPMLKQLEKKAKPQGIEGPLRNQV